MKTSLTVLLATLSAILSVSCVSVRADNKAPVAKKQPASISAQPLIIQAQGHPKHLDFVARSSKRADLRANIARKGLNVAFTEWLCAEHAHIYRQHLEQTARQNQKTGEKTIAER